MAGLAVLAWLASEARGKVPWRAVLMGFALELVLAAVCLKLPGVKNAFMALNDALLVLEKATQAGTSLVFGYLGGATPPFPVSAPEASFVLALSWLLRKVMGVGGVLGLSTAANVFVGMVEAPLFVRPYLARVSRHLLIASILSAPAALAVSFLMVPPAGEATAGDLELRSEASGTMDAITRGTLEGAQLLVNIAAMLVVFVALVALVNLIIARYSLQALLGFSLLGTKTPRRDRRARHEVDRRRHARHVFHGRQRRLDFVGLSCLQSCSCPTTAGSLF